MVTRRWTRRLAPVPFVGRGIHFDQTPLPPAVARSAVFSILRAEPIGADVGSSAYEQPHWYDHFGEKYFSISRSYDIITKMSLIVQTPNECVNWRGWAIPSHLY